MKVKFDAILIDHAIATSVVQPERCPSIHILARKLLLLQSMLHTTIEMVLSDFQLKVRIVWETVQSFNSLQYFAVRDRSRPARNSRAFLIEPVPRIFFFFSKDFGMRPVQFRAIVRIYAGFCHIFIGDFLDIFFFAPKNNHEKIVQKNRSKVHNKVPFPIELLAVSIVQRNKHSTGTTARAVLWETSAGCSKRLLKRNGCKMYSTSVHPLSLSPEC